VRAAPRRTDVEGKRLGESTSDLMRLCSAFESVVARKGTMKQFSMPTVQYAMFGGITGVPLVLNLQSPSARGCAPVSSADVLAVDHARSTNRATKLREPQRTDSASWRLNKRHKRQRRSFQLYRTHEVAGSSPASSTAY
jgi:hypothetical protein